MELVGDLILVLLAALAGGFLARRIGQPLIVGYILTWTNQNWTLTFYVSCGIYLIGGLCWLFIDAHKPLEE